MELKIEEALKLTYEEYIEYLFKKYGTVKDYLKTKQKTDKELNGNYFLTDSFKSKNSNITRGSEGLFIHHIDEDKAIMLSTKSYAMKNPYEFQKPERLVYCDLIEHLILHLKIVENPKPLRKTEHVGIGGFVNFIAPSLLDFYAGYEPEKNHYLYKVKQRIINKINDFLIVLKYIKNNKIFEKYYQKYYEWNRDTLLKISNIEYVNSMAKLRINPSLTQLDKIFKIDMNSSIVKEVENLGWKVIDLETFIKEIHAKFKFSNEQEMQQPKHNKFKEWWIKFKKYFSLKY